jgi:hypothetical protein
MSAEELLKQLDEWHEGIPRELLREAVRRREEVTPGLIAAVEEIANNPKPFFDDPERNLYYWAAYLLAHFEEKAAFQAITRLIRVSGGEFGDVVSDLVQEDGAMLLANVCGGEIGPICGLLHDKTLSEDARVAAAEALGFLVSWGAVEAERVIPEFKRALEETQEKESLFGAHIVNAGCDLNLRQLEPVIKDAYERGVVDRDTADLEFVGEWLHDPDFEPPPPYVHMVQSIDDIVEFFEEKIQIESMRPGGGDVEDEDYENPLLDLPPATADDMGRTIFSGGTYRPPPTPGRNDPCPCGSGKKYKKCCGA